MSYTIRNIRPSVLHIPDAALRLESGQAAVVTTLSPQMGELVALRAIEVVANDLPRIAPTVATTVPDAPPPPVSATAMPVPDEAPAETPADSHAAMPPVEEKRGGRKAAAHAVTVEERDDAQ